MKRDRKTEGKLVLANLKVGEKTHRSTSKSILKLPPNIYEELPVGIAETSIEGKYINANAEFCRIVGYEREQLSSLSIQDIIFEEDYPVIDILYKQLVEGKISSYVVEKRYRRKEGTVVWVAAKRSIVSGSQGKALHTVVVALDISEIRREEKLREQLENLVQQRTVVLEEVIRSLQEEMARRIDHEGLWRSWAHIFEHADMGIATVFQDRYVKVNPAFARMHGYTAEELIGRSIYDLKAAESHADTRKQIRIAYEVGHNIYESIHLRKDGSTFPALIDTSIVRGDEGNVLYRALHVRDITEQKQAEKVLEESRQRLQELPRRLIEAQEEAARAIAAELHDRVGQNVSALKLNLTMIENQALHDLSAEKLAQLQDSIRLVDDTTRLVRDLLNELRPSALEEYGLKEALQSYIDEFTLRSGIKVVLDVANEPLPRLDPNLKITVLRIAQEALTNVARYAQANSAMLSLRLEHATIYLTVLDDGIGIEAAKRTTTPRISHGIKIMRERAEAFRGTVKVGPAEGRGTKVEAVIPMEA
jgi:PAS domain S-box-containing protein